MSLIEFLLHHTYTVDDSFQGRQELTAFLMQLRDHGVPDSAFGVANHNLKIPVHFPVTTVVGSAAVLGGIRGDEMQAGSAMAGATSTSRLEARLRRRGDSIESGDISSVGRSASALQVHPSLQQLMFFLCKANPPLHRAAWYGKIAYMHQLLVGSGQIALCSLQNLRTQAACSAHAG